jgi:hypothetical protein
VSQLQILQQQTADNVLVQWPAPATRSDVIRILIRVIPETGMLCDVNCRDRSCVTSHANVLVFDPARDVLLLMRHREKWRYRICLF